MNALKTYAIVTPLIAVMATAAHAQADSEDLSSVSCAQYRDFDDALQLQAATDLVTRLGSRQNPDSAKVRLRSICGSNEGATSILTAATAGMTMDN
ncbi:hypothetical protein [Roseivivax sediminis]|uniref:HdeA/HdeB family protein n=1 Tax=Roseivivax sediminis TaxID=936889 RepID=A0A1I1SWC6_9RHOB|nr:hypothetical protein [Roseivivax sediminis]SFD50767.1 hypothetical protein SAMN04515678_101369 [Roseivivax sediminis]